MRVGAVIYSVAMIVSLLVFLGSFIWAGFAIGSDPYGIEFNHRMGVVFAAQGACLILVFGKKAWRSFRK